jgi:hypothetical protein
LGSRDRLRAKLQGGGSGRNSPALPGGGQLSYGSGPAGYDSMGAGGGSGSPYTAASEPWSSGNGQYQYDSGQTGASGNPYRPRPGGPR